MFSVILFTLICNITNNYNLNFFVLFIIILLFYATFIFLITIKISTVVLIF